MQSESFDIPAREKSPDELDWPVRLFVILLGYSTVVIPSALLIFYVRRNLHDFEGHSRSFKRLLKSFAVGSPEYQLIPNSPSSSSKSSNSTIDSVPHTRSQCIQTTVLLLFFFSGIQITLVAMGYLQERIITQGYVKRDGKLTDTVEKFEEVQFLIFCNRIVALFLSLLILARDWRQQPPHVPPLYVHSYTSFSNTISSWCQYEALKYVSFPTQTICKASKVVVTMLMGRIVRGQRYSCFEYMCGLTIAFGASLFLLSSSQSHSTITYTSFSGMLLMAGYLLFDAFTLNWQKSLFDTKPKVSKYQMMFGVNFFSAILCAVSLIEQKTLFSSIQFAAEHDNFTRDVFLLSFSGAVGQMFIYSTIEKFGPIVFAVIMTIRQMLSILLSTFMYNHDLSFWSAIGFLIRKIRLFNYQRLA
ncbi:unnamed protein product [Caenorhabditis angaria]|uniref:Adenosine 3'-phospho 5'-phosphosulfate transporter 1 n=1 Tax=Caenorhabditis angaria TaxID=860376 RepID=A0A9P1N584_9PELO|nr:unnamed protein product [Caenorhabditis angaria]